MLKEQTFTMWIYWRCI